MKYISVYEAKTQLSKYISMLESKQKDSIVICKNGKPVAELIPFVERKERRLGVAKGMWRDVSEEEFNDFDMFSLLIAGKK